jgi:hypothetical protein
MKQRFSILIFVLVVANVGFAHEEKLIDNFAEGPVCLNAKDFKFKDNHLEIYPKDNTYSKIIITENYLLYIDGEKIPLNYSTKKLLKTYYDEVYEIRDKAIDIGIAGAKIGLSGAKIGLTAVASLPLLIFSGSEEYEARMEAAGEELEAKAEILEERADELEKQTEKLQDLEYELKERVKELDDLYWF